MAFSGVEDHFRGVTVDSSTFATAQIEHFSAELVKSESIWREAGKRCIWFKIDNAQSELIPVLIKNGYDFHHAKPGGAMLKKWLSIDDRDNVPHYPFTFIGVGGLVIKDNQVLLVKERFALTSKWKLPGGHVDSGEDLGVAAVREVHEETGIETRELGVITFRHTHPHPQLNFPSHKCSDIYMIVLLTVDEVKEAVRQEAEIAAVQWHQIDKILASDDIHEHNKNYIREGVRRLADNTTIKLEKEDSNFNGIPRQMSIYRITN